ncbi:hypothetical protein FPV16_21745 [Methylobacterium sp. W2]|nr:hypothetical protein [Methylobacterium sp. W2]
MARAADEMEMAYFKASDGDVLTEMASLSGQVSRGYVRAKTPSDLARKLGPERWEREAAGSR